jgi:hypothetical protein
LRVIVSSVTADPTSAGQQKIDAPDTWVYGSCVLSYTRPGHPAVPPTAPDYPKFLKRIGYVCAGIVIGYAASGGLIALRGAAMALFGVLVAVMVGWIVSGVLVCRSFGPEERERRQGPDRMPRPRARGARPPRR